MNTILVDEKQETTSELCCLCLEPLSSNKICIRLVCNHEMDYNCFLNLRRAQCPLCRHEIESPTQFIPPSFVQAQHSNNPWNSPVEDEDEQQLLERRNSLILDLSDIITPRQTPQFFHQDGESQYSMHVQRAARERMRRQERRHRQRERRRLLNQAFLNVVQSPFSFIDLEE
jgi:hypothetical protein